MTNNVEDLISGIRCTLNTLASTHPQQADTIKDICQKIDSKKLPSAGILLELKKLRQNIANERDQAAVDIRIAKQTVNKLLTALLRSPHLSAKHNDVIKGIDIKDITSAASVINELATLLQLFANDTLEFRARSSIIVGDEHQKLKKSESNIIAGDVATFSKIVVRALAPLLQRFVAENPGNNDLIACLSQAKEMNGKKIVDFFEASNLMETSLGLITRTLAQKNASEAEYLKGFQNQLEAIHSVLGVTLKDSVASDNANGAEQQKITELLKRFKQASSSEDDPTKLRSLIAENISHINAGVKVIVDQTQTQRQKQCNVVLKLQTEISTQRMAYAKIEKEKRALAETMGNLESISLTDPLTKVGNRRAYDQYLKNSDKGILASPHVGLYGMIVLDIDHFKTINDTHGHKCGDAVLAETCSLVKNFICDSEVMKDKVEIFRYGGEEFVLCYKQLKIQEAIKLAELLRGKIKKHTCKIDGYPPINITVSIGVAAYSPEFSSGTQVFDFADKALYQSKDTGRDQVSVFVIQKGVKKFINLNSLKGAAAA